MTDNDRTPGYYWITRDDVDEAIPAAWVGGNWYLIGQVQPAQLQYKVHEIGRIEPPK